MPSGSSSSRHSCVVLALQLVGEDLVQRLDMLRARFAVGEPRVALEPLGLADRAHEGLPLLVGVDDEAHQAVLRGVRPPLRVEQPRIAEAAARRDERVAVQMIAQHHLRGRLEHRHVDRLPAAGAFAREQRRADHAERVQARRAVREVERRVARHVGSRPHAGLGDRDGGLDQVVEGAQRRIAAALAEAEGADIDDARVHLPHRFVVEPEALHRLRPHVVDQRVGRLRELQQRLLAFRALQVQHDAALVAVQVEEQRAGARAPAGTGGAQHVAAGRLHLDHVGTEVRQHLGRRRTHDDFGDVDDAQAGERPALVRVVFHSARAPLSDQEPFTSAPLPRM